TTTIPTTVPTPTVSLTTTIPTTAPTLTASPTTTIPTTDPTPTASPITTTPTTDPMPTASPITTTPTTVPMPTASPITTTPTTVPMPTVSPTTTSPITAMMTGTMTMTTMIIGMTTTMMTTTGTTNPPRLRHESKHQVSPQEDLVLAGRLRRLFPHDAHAGPEGSYRITSLYFDTPYDAALREKLDGVDRREKFRLRYYGESPAWLKLEKKYKVNGLCGKRSARLSTEEAEGLLAGDWGFLLERGEPLL